jgi:hypothetical protein
MYSKIEAKNISEKKLFFVGMLKPLPKREGSGSVIQFMDPRIRIRIKM